MAYQMSGCPGPDQQVTGGLKGCCAISGRKAAKQDRTSQGFVLKVIFVLLLRLIHISSYVECFFLLFDVFRSRIFSNTFTQWFR